jgi:hypothetical protein
MNQPSALLLLAATLGAAACTPPPPTHGDFSFTWSFGGEPSCALARVAEVDVIVVDAQDRIVHESTESCEGSGLTLLDFREGDYLLVLDAYSFRGQLVFQADTEFSIVPGETVDLGEILLRRPGEAETGDITFVWSFDGETDCDAAGVDEIDVAVWELGTDVNLLSETATCEGEGLYLLDLPPGNVDVTVDAFDDADNWLYAGEAVATVVADRLTDLGTLVLDPAP